MYLTAQSVRITYGSPGQSALVINEVVVATGDERTITSFCSEITQMCAELLAMQRALRAVEVLLRSPLIREELKKLAVTDEAARLLLDQ